MYETTPLPFDFNDDDFFLDIEVARSAGLDENAWDSAIVSEDWSAHIQYLSENEPLILGWTQMWLIRNWRITDLIDVSEHHLGGPMQYALPFLVRPEFRRLIEGGPGRGIPDLLVIDAIHMDPRITRRGFGTQLVRRTLQLIPSLAPVLLVTIPESVNPHNDDDPDADVRFWLEHVGLAHVGHGILIDIHDPARADAVEAWKARVSVPFTEADRDDS